MKIDWQCFGYGVVLGLLGFQAVVMAGLLYKTEAMSRHLHELEAKMIVLKRIVQDDS